MTVTMAPRSQTLALFVGQAAAAGVQICLFALLGNLFSQATLGRYTLVLSVATPVFLAFGLSLRILYVAADEYWDPVWFGRKAVQIAVVCAFVSFALAVALGSSVGFAVLVAVVKALDLVAYAGIGVLQRQGRLSIGAAILIANCVVSLVGAISFGIACESPELLLLGSALGSLAGAGLAWLMALKHCSSQESMKTCGTLVDLLGRGIPLGGSTAIVSLATNVPIYFLARSGDIEVVAAYAVLANLRTIANMGYSAISQVVLVRLAECVRSRSRHRFAQQMRRAMVVIALLSVGVAVPLVAAGPRLIPLAFGVEIHRWLPSMLVLALGFAAAGVIYIVDAGLSALHSYRIQLVTGLVTLATTTAVVLFAQNDLDLLAALSALTLGLWAGALFKLAYIRFLMRRANEFV